MSLKRGDVVTFSDKSFGAIESTDGKTAFIFLNGESKQFSITALKKVLCPVIAKCEKCGCTPFVGKHPARARQENKWRVYCVCDGPGQWSETKGKAIIAWNGAA